MAIYWLYTNTEDSSPFTRRKVGYPTYWEGRKQPKMKTQINAAATAGANAIRA